MLNKWGEAAQRDNYQQSLDPRNIAVPGIVEPVYERRPMNPATILVSGAVGILGWCWLYALLGLSAWWSCNSYDDSTRCLIINNLQLALDLATLALGAFGAVTGIFLALTSAKARNARVGVVRDALNQPMSVAMVHRMDVDTYARFFATNAQLLRDIAPYRQIPVGLDAFHGAMPMVSQPALSAPAADVIDVGPVPSVTWLPWLAQRPHVILAAETGGGKSTLAKAILAGEIQRGSKVFIIDPHSSSWFGLQGVGGGEDWNAVANAIARIVEEYTNRLKRRGQYLADHGEDMPVGDFERLVVLFDEANNAKAAYECARKSTWSDFAKVLGSGARKVGISIISLAQSANVEDLGISGGMRNNFTRIALDDRSIKIMINDEPDRARKAAMLDKLPGLSYPATTIINSQVVFLDRTGLDRVAPPESPGRALWVPPSVCLSDEENVLESLLSEIPDRQTTDVVAFLVSCAQSGMARDAAYKAARAAGFRFNNTDLRWPSIKAMA